MPASTLVWGYRLSAPSGCISSHADEGRLSLTRTATVCSNCIRDTTVARVWEIYGMIYIIFVLAKNQKRKIELQEI